jgi:hypothetical protein
VFLRVGLGHLGVGPGLPGLEWVPGVGPGVSPMGVSPAGVGASSGPGSGSRTGPGGSRSGSGSKGGSKREPQSQSEWLLERLDGSDAAWLSHWSRLMHLSCKDSCCC